MLDWWGPLYAALCMCGVLLLTRCRHVCPRCFFAVGQHVLFLGLGSMLIEFWETKRRTTHFAGGPTPENTHTHTPPDTRHPGSREEDVCTFRGFVLQLSAELFSDQLRACEHREVLKQQLGSMDLKSR